jgi:tRNA-guanine family transglycosylase
MESDIMELVYVPVLYDVSKGARWEWYTGASGLKHPYVLISAGDGTYGIYGRSQFNKPPGVKLLADSGGFQLQKEGVYISPEVVAKWQEHIDADVRFILDHPPLIRTDTVSGQKPLHGADFRKKLDETIADTKRMLATYKNPDKETYGVLQGETIEEIIQWRDEVNALHPFAGWGLGSTFGDVAQFRLKIKLLGEIGVKKIHLFGVTDPAMLIVVARAMRKYNVEYCTFDSTSYIGTKFSSVWYPIVHNQVSWFSRTENRPTLRLVCDCPVCRVLTPNASLDERDNKELEENVRRHKEVEFGYKVGVHNIYWINQMARSIQELSKYEELLAELEKDYSSRVFDSKIDQTKKATDYE